MSNFPIRHFLVLAHKLAVEPSLSNQSTQGTILCVEDNKAYLRVRKAVLEREGYSVLAASTEDEALRLFREVAVFIALLFDYLVESRGWKNGVAKSVATTNLINALARHHGVEL